MKKSKIILFVCILSLIGLITEVYSKPPVKMDKDRETKIKAEIRSSDSAVKNQALRELLSAKEGAVALLPDVISLLETEENPDSRALLFAVLSRTGTGEAINALKRAYNNAAGDEKLKVAGVLSKNGDATVIPVLKDVLNDENETRGRKSLALRALANLKTTESVNILKKMLKDADFALRLQAVSSLGKIGTKEALTAISGMLSDPDEKVRKLAENILNRQ